MAIKIQNPKTRQFETSHVGMVLETYIKNYWDDWDDMAVVYNPEKDTFDHVIYGTTRGYMFGSAQVDASEELQQMYRARLAKAAQEYLERDRAENPDKYVHRGDQVRIVRGRKIAKGTEGRVFWVGMTRFGKSIGVQKLDGEKFFVSAKNIEIIGEAA